MAAALLGRLDELHTRVDGGMPLHDVDLAIVSEAEAAVRSGQYGEELRVKFTKVALDTANQLSRLNMLADALSTYNLLVPHFSDAGVLFNVGMVHIKLGDLSEAYECFVEATNKVSPVPSKFWKALAALGMVQMQQEDYAAAAKSFNRASTCSNKKSAIVLYNAGLCELKLGDKTAARQHLMNALELEPGMRSAEEALRECASVEVADDGAGSAWQEVLTADGTTYYYNAHSGETSWEKPAELLGAGGGDGGAVDGVPPHATGAEAEAGAADWAEMSTAEGRVYYFNSRTQESTWEDPRIAAAATTSSAEEDWEERRADSGHLYYFNRQTLVSSWEKPAGFGGAEQEGEGGGATASALASSVATAADADDESSTGSEWVELAAKDGTPYYYNKVTQESTWERPKGLARGSIANRTTTSSRRSSISHYDHIKAPPHRDLFEHHDDDDFPEVSYDAIVRMKREELPPDFDPNIKERYLSDADFGAILGMEKRAFYELPRWQQIQLKIENKLF